MNNNYEIPDWINNLDLVNNDLIIDMKRLEGGVVSEVWCIELKNKGKYVFRKTVMKTENLSKVSNNLNIATNTGYFPKKFGVKVEKNYLITYYLWVKGNALKSFNGNLQVILYKLGEIHAFNGFDNVKSIYSNIFEEAEYVKNHIDNCGIFLTKDKQKLKYMCNNISGKFSKRELNRLLNCRGRMTHGDPKPANVIINGDSIQFIDWDKICTLSPEADIIYALFTGCNFYNFNLKKIIKFLQQSTELSNTILNMAVLFLPDLYIIHDLYIYISTETRYEYVIDEVFPLWNSWQKKIKNMGL